MPKIVFLAVLGKSKLTLFETRLTLVWQQIDTQKWINRLIDGRITRRID